jgi:hypothetical protein
MSSTEIAKLEHAGRVAMAWSPEGYDQEIRFAPLLVAFVPAVSLVVVALTFLISFI